MGPDVPLVSHVIPWQRTLSLHNTCTTVSERDGSYSLVWYCIDALGG